jgi:hypothetical protein
MPFNNGIANFIQAAGFGEAINNAILSAFGIEFEQNWRIGMPLPN